MKERAQQLANQGRTDGRCGEKKQSGQTATEKPSHISRLFKEQTADSKHGTQRWGFTL